MRYIVQLLFVVCVAGFSYAGAVGTGDFAAGYYLEVAGEGAIYSLELPEEVYRTVTRADLGDIRVFNNAGEVVPHGLQKAEGDPEAGRTREPVPFFPMYEGMSWRAPLSVSVQVGGTGAGKGSDGTIVKINPAPTGDSAERKLIGYLLDVSGLKSAPKTLEFQWSSDSPSSVVRIQLQQSDNLVTWKPLVRRATLANLNYGGYVVEKMSVPLPYRPGKYLKLTWLANSEDLSLTDVAGVSGVAPSRLQGRWISLNTKTAARDNGILHLDFTSRYHLPVNRAQLRFSQTNSLARVSLSSRPDNDSQWQVRCRQLFYNLRLEGEAVQNEPCMFSPRSDALWRLAIEEDGAGLGESGKGLALQLGWTPSKLYFVGRGSPPYLLAFGSGKLQQDEKSAATRMVLQAMETAATDRSILKAGIGSRVELGGDQALQPPAAKPPWKMWLLWGVLVMGVGVLAVMARSLIREMKVARGEGDSSQQ